MKKLMVYSIFLSISGEVGLFKQGSFTTFIRLAGCNIHCGYCDTPNTLRMDSGTSQSIESIIEAVEAIGCKQVLITGGEPLMQRTALNDLVYNLQVKGYNIQIETNGSFVPQLETTDPICWVIDYKLRGSLMEHRMPPIDKFVRQVPYNSWVKFVCCDEDDFNQALEVIKLIKTVLPYGSIQFAMSPAGFPGKELYKWMRDKRLYDIVLNTQIHKFIFPEGEEEIK